MSTVEPAAVPASDSRGDQPRASILIVDDRPDNLLVLESILQDLDAELVKASSGFEALRCLLHTDFALILIDVQMPEMDGLELATIIRARDRAAATPIIFVTAADQGEAQVFRGYSAGAVDYIFKPMDPEILRSKVRVFLNLYRNAEQIRQQAEQLRKSEERYALAARAAADGLWDWDLTSNSMYLSPRWKQIVGCSARQMSDSPEEWFSRIAPEDLDRVRAELQAHIDSPSPPFQSEFRMSRADGEYIWVLCRGMAVRDANGNAVRVAGSLSDITKRKVAEEELKQRERLATIGMTVSTIAHCTKNTLAAIKMGVELMASSLADKDDQQVDSRLAVVRSSVTRLDQLMMNMLDSSKERVVLREPVHVTELLREIEQTIETIATRRNVNVQVQVQDGLDVIYTDFQRLSRALVNLGMNAIDAVPPSGGELRIRVSTASSEIGAGAHVVVNDVEEMIDENSLVVEIEDNGSGIPADIHHKIFEPFFSTKCSRGTGLGLSSVKQFVIDHKAALWLKTAPGAGTVFRLVLPGVLRAVEPAPADTREEFRRKQAAASEGERPRRESLKLLLVEDEYEAATAMSQLLRMWGHQVEVAPDGEEALRQFDSAAPDVILLDMGLPGITGYEVAQAIRSKPTGENVTIIALTGYGDDADVQHAISAGCDYHLVKPPRLPDLRQLLERA